MNSINAITNDIFLQKNMFYPDILKLFKVNVKFPYNISFNAIGYATFRWSIAFTRQTKFYFLPCLENVDRILI